MRPLFAPKAKLDLRDIWRFTAVRWDEAQAERYLRELVGICDALAAGTARSIAIDAVRPGYRKRLAGSHVVYFRFRTDGRMEVIRILHQRMDVESRL